MSHLKNNLTPTLLILFIGFSVVFFWNPSAHIVDMWDGVIINYAADINNYTGLQNWFYESGWHAQYWVSLTIINLSKLITLDYLTTNLILITLIAFFIYSNLIQLSNKKIGLDFNSTRYVAFFFLSLHVWATLNSTVMTFHLLCLYCCISSIQMIHQKKPLKVVAGLIILIPSLTLQSLVSFAPAFSLLLDATSSKNSKSLRQIVSNETLLVTFITTIIFCLFRYFFVPNGLYENYNQIIFHDFTSIKVILNNLKNFGTFLYGIILILTINLIFNARIIHKQRNTTIELCLIILLFASIAPYILAGKSTSYLDYQDWEGRHGLLLTIPLSLIFGYTHRLVSHDFSSKKSIYIKIFIGLIFLNLIFLSKSASQKVTRQHFQKNLEIEIRKKINSIPPGRLKIYGDGIPRPYFRTYESNYLMYRATENADWWTSITNDRPDDQDIPNYIKTNKAYNFKYIFNFNSDKIPCKTTMHIHASGYDSTLNEFRLWLTNSEKNLSIEILDIKSSCQ